MTVFMCVIFENEQKESPRQDAKPARLITPQPVLILAESVEKAKLEVVLQLNLEDVDRKRMEVLARPF